MADIVMAYGASHAPMMTADPESAPDAQAENFFGALDTIREKAAAAGVQAVVMMSGEHFSNFFYDNLPQIVIGLGEGHVGPREKWLKVPEVLVPGEPGLAAHLLAETIAAGFQPALSHKMVADHGFMTVYYKLDPKMRLPMVPIVMNCTTATLDDTAPRVRLRRRGRRCDSQLPRPGAGRAVRGGRPFPFRRRATCG